MEVSRFLSEEDTKIILNGIGKPSLTNCYLSYLDIQKKLIDGEIHVYSNQDIVVLVEEIHGTYKMYYFLKDSGELNDDIYRALSREMEKYDFLTTDIITKGKSGHLNIVKKMGFDFYKKYFRLQLIADKEKVFPLPEKAVFAEEKDVDEIYELLYGSFDVLSDHLLTKEELNQSLISHRVIKICKNGELAGILISEKHGVKSYLRALCVNAKYRNMDIGFSLMGNYINMHRKESKSFYLWVESTNQSAINLYEKFGYQSDGLKDYIYLCQKCVVS